MRLTRTALVAFLGFLILSSAITPTNAVHAAESDYYTVIISANIPSMNITIDGQGYTVTNSTFVLTNTSHQLTVQYEILIEPDTRYAFQSWGDGTAALTKTIYQEGQYNAHYITQYYFSVSAEQGSVEGTGWYTRGSTATTTFALETITNGSTRYLFQHWDIDGLTTTGNPVTVSMHSPHRAWADYETQYLFSVSAEHGSVEGTEWYAPSRFASTGEAPVNITEGDTRYLFQHWDVDGSEKIGNPITVIMDAPHTATANYSTQYYLDIQSEYDGIDGAGWHDTNSSAQVSVKPVVGTLIRHKFNGWSGDIGGNESTVSIYMDRPKSIVATWKTDFLFLHVLIGGLIAVIVAAAVAVPTALHMRKKH